MAGTRSLWLLVGLLAAAVVFLGVACNGNGNGDGGRAIGITVGSPSPTPVSTAASTPTPTPTPSPSPSPTPGRKVCGVNPDPAPPSVLQVQEPQPNQQVKPVFHVRGWASSPVFDEIGLVVAVVDANGELVDVMVDVPPQPRAYRALPSGLQNTEFTHPFAVDIILTGLADPKPLCLWVFLETDAEGNPKQMVQVPIVVAP